MNLSELQNAIEAIFAINQPDFEGSIKYIAESVMPAGATREQMKILEVAARKWHDPTLTDKQLREHFSNAIRSI